MILVFGRWSNNFWTVLPQSRPCSSSDVWADWYTFNINSSLLICLFQCQVKSNQCPSMTHSSAPVNQVGLTFRTSSTRHLFVQGQEGHGVVWISVIMDLSGSLWSGQDMKWYWMICKECVTVVTIIHMIGISHINITYTTNVYCTVLAGILHVNTRTKVLLLISKDA